MNQISTIQGWGACQVRLSCRGHLKGDLRSVLLSGSSGLSFLSFHNILFQLFLKLTHEVFSAIPRPPLWNHFESWLHRSVGTDPSQPPCQSPVSTYRWFPQMPAFLSVWAGPPHSRGSQWEMDGQEETSKHLLRSNWPLWCPPLRELFCSLIFLPLSILIGKRTTRDRALPVFQVLHFTYLAENAISYEMLHMTFFYLVWHVVTKMVAVFPLQEYLLVKTGSSVHCKFIWRHHSHYLTCHGLFGCRKRNIGPKQGDERIWCRKNSLRFEVRQTWILNLLWHSDVIFKDSLNFPRSLFPHLKNEVNDTQTDLKQERKMVGPCQSIGYNKCVQETE